MDGKIKENLEKKGHVISLTDFEIVLHWDDGNPFYLTAEIFRKEKDNRGNHINKFSDKEIDILIQDINDLSDWRHYRRLTNKLRE